jgi:hypothetical protein
MKRNPLVFAIPVMPRCRSANWSEVESNLTNTVNSVLASSDSRVLVVIAHHEKPAGDYWSDSRVVSVDLGNSQIPEGKTDQRQKKKAVGCWLRNNGYDEVYAMFLDADDLVNVNLSSYVLKDNNAQGYWIPHGYHFDYDNMRGAPFFDRFNQTCGSCFIGYYLNGELPASETDNGSVYSRICDSKHKDHHVTAKELGKNVQPIPFLAAVYMRNHVNSIAQRRENRKRTVVKGIFNSAPISQSYLERYFNLEFEHSVDTGNRFLKIIGFYFLDSYIKLIIKSKKSGLR